MSFRPVISPGGNYDHNVAELPPWLPTRRLLRRKQWKCRLVSQGAYTQSTSRDFSKMASRRNLQKHLEQGNGGSSQMSVSMSPKVFVGGTLLRTNVASIGVPTEHAESGKTETAFPSMVSFVFFTTKPQITLDSNTTHSGLNHSLSHRVWRFRNCGTRADVVGETEHAIECGMRRCVLGKPSLEVRIMIEPRSVPGEGAEYLGAVFSHCFDSRKDQKNFQFPEGKRTFHHLSGYRNLDSGSG